MIIYDLENSNKSEDVILPKIGADQDGICLWRWEVPIDAKEGTAVFRAADLNKIMYTIQLCHIRFVSKNVRGDNRQINRSVLPMFE